MKIAQKLGLLVAALLVAMLATIVVLSAQIRTISAEYDGLLDEQVRQGAQARLMQVEFGKQVQAFDNILLRGGDPAELAEYNAIYAEQQATVRNLASELLTGTADSRLRASLAQFVSSHDTLDVAYRSAYDGFLASGRTDITGAGSAVLGQDRFPTDLIDIIVDHTQRSIDEAVVTQQNSVQRQLQWIYGLGAALLLLVAVAVSLVIRGIVKPVRVLTAAARDAAEHRLPRVVAQISTLSDDAPAPALPRFEVSTRDELAELAAALTSLQDSAVGLALDQRRDEQANSETLVNLGRRNQGLLTRMLSYVTELERDERDPQRLDTLYRLDHLTTRIRRNAESLLVLAGAKQTRAWTQPLAIDDLLRAALSEIEEHARVTVQHADHARVHGSVGADLTHLLAELLENATRFAPPEHPVRVVGRLTPSGYQFDLIDAGPGMSATDLETANSRIVQPGQRRPDTKALGHHVVGRIATRRGIHVRLLPSAPTGITAQVLVPETLLSDVGAARAVPRRAPAVEAAPGPPGPPGLPAPRPQPALPPGGVPGRDTDTRSLEDRRA